MNVLLVLNQHVPALLTWCILKMDSALQVLVWTSVRFSCVLKGFMGFSLSLVGVIYCLLPKLSFDLLIIYVWMYLFIDRQCKVKKWTIELITLLTLLLWPEVLITGEASIIFWALKNNVGLFFFLEPHYKCRLYNDITDFQIKYKNNQNALHVNIFDDWLICYQSLA